MRLWCDLPTSKKFIVQLSAVVKRLGAQHRKSACVAKSAFYEGVKSLLANISQRRGRRPPTTVGVRKLE